METFCYLEQEVESDRRVIWNTAAPIASQVTTFLINCTLPPTIAKLLSKKLSCTQPNHQITMKVVNHIPIRKSHIILLKISETFYAAKHNNKKGGGGGKGKENMLK